jgi:hypothetical protein
MSRNPPRAVLVPALAAAAALVVAAALAAAAAALAATPASTAAYRGKTSQGIAVTLGAPAGGERTFRYRARLKCTDGTSWLDDYFTDRVTVRAGRFSSHHSSDRGAIVTTVTGKLAGHRASGTISILERFSPVLGAGGVTPLSGTGTIRCQSAIVRWNARGG